MRRGGEQCLHKAPCQPGIAKFVEALDPFIWLIAAVILGAILAIILIKAGSAPPVAD